MLKPRFIALAISAGLILCAGVVSGQDPSTELRTGYPNKAIHIVAGPVGGANDLVARQIARAISDPLGQPVIVDNRAPLITIETVAKAPPDGYTLILRGGALWILPLLEKVNYDVVRDFLPVTLVSAEPNVVTVHPSLPVKSVKEVIALAKARPGELNYASSSTGGAVHLSAELFKSMAGVNIVRIPYTGTGPALRALLSGEVQLIIIDAGLVAPQVKLGKMRALAVTSAQPSALAPGLPTVAASGLPGYEMVGITGILAPAKTPGAVINRLHQEVARFLNRADVKEGFLNAGSEVVASAPEQFAATIKAEIAKWDKVIKGAGISAN